MVQYRSIPGPKPAADHRELGRSPNPTPGGLPWPTTSGRSEAKACTHWGAGEDRPQGGSEPDPMPGGTTGRWCRQLRGAIGTPLHSVCAMEGTKLVVLPPNQGVAVGRPKKPTAIKQKDHFWAGFGCETLS